MSSTSTTEVEKKKGLEWPPKKSEESLELEKSDTMEVEEKKVGTYELDGKELKLKSLSPPPIVEAKKTCIQCGNVVGPSWRACVVCGQYILAPGEVIDLSKPDMGIKFALTHSMAARRPPIAVNDHDMPCPPQTTERIEDDQDVQAWVMNHLPLTEEQKIQLACELAEDKKEVQQFKRHVELKKRIDEAQTRFKERQNKRKEEVSRGRSRHAVKVSEVRTRTSHYPKGTK